MAGNVFVSNIQVGPKMCITFDHFGPTSYANPAGDIINASDLGVGGFEFVDLENISPDGTKFVQVIPVAQGGGNATSSVTLRWFACAGAIQGTEITNATNLSTFSVRMQLFAV